MIVRTALAEKTVKDIKQVIPEATFAVGNWHGECAARPMQVIANFWYELRSESPGVIYLPMRGAVMVSTDRQNKDLASV